MLINFHMELRLTADGIWFQEISATFLSSACSGLLTKPLEKTIPKKLEVVFLLASNSGN